MGWAHPRPGPPPPSRNRGAVPGWLLPRTCPQDTWEQGWWRTQGPGPGALAAGSLPAGSQPLQHLRTPSTRRSSSSQVFPKKQLKIYPAWTGDLVGSWLPTSRQVGVGGRGQERGSPKLSPSKSWSRSGCRTRQRRDWALSGASTGLSCRAGHRWETIAFCPGASHARAAQGG